MQQQAEIGIIGGSGLYAMPGLVDVHEQMVHTPFGKPSDAYVIGTLEGRKVAFLAQFRDPDERADNLYREWRGGTYFAVLRCDLAPCESSTKQQKKNQEPAAAPPTSALALLYLSRWSNPDAAVGFAKQYRDTLLKRYKFAQGVAPRVGDAPTTRWMTDEGLVSIEVRGDQVLVLESFDDAAMKKLSEAIWQTPVSAAN